MTLALGGLKFSVCEAVMSIAAHLCLPCGRNQWQMERALVICQGKSAALSDEAAKAVFPRQAVAERFLLLVGVSKGISTFLRTQAEISFSYEQCEWAHQGHHPHPRFLHLFLPSAYLMLV